MKVSLLTRNVSRRELSDGFIDTDIHGTLSSIYSGKINNEQERIAELLIIAKKLKATEVMLPSSITGSFKKSLLKRLLGAGIRVVLQKE